MLETRILGRIRIISTFLSRIGVEVAVALERARALPITHVRPEAPTVRQCNALQIEFGPALSENFFPEGCLRGAAAVVRKSGSDPERIITRQLRPYRRLKHKTGP